ncbi:serpin B [Mariniphaga anaerophila]|uniref:Serpin B n=1 Tax=Mariniphaga anaerophila TaxID=1484053 RepID=A0A1M4VFD5_9BACT|nr:serpin family protein [Mariniphaga anaerophila]SHE67677.1 serpin B [Mariniphaga anaerophila]
MKIILLFPLAFILTSVNSCHKNELNHGENKVIRLDEKSARLVEADNTFGVELFQKIREESSEENLMVSPLSISIALAMAYNGADGATKTEMENVLKLNGLSADNINASYKMFIRALQSLDEEVALEIANAIFYAEGFSVKKSFVSVNEATYGAEISELNFGSPTAVESINNWVAEKTHDKIQTIIDQLNPMDRMVLLNAVYFYGTWTNKFDEQGTHNLPFHKTDGTTKQVPMMSKLENLPYTSNNLFSAIKMPYGNGQYNMVVLLPALENNSQDVIDELSSANWESWMKNFEMTERVRVTMPRFKYAFKTELNKVLQIMGMQNAFNPDAADFSGITDDELFISSAIHKSYIDVNETGTEAAAVTGMTFSTTSMGTEPPTVPFYVNKPFVYAIIEKDTGAILFIGEVKNPEYN